MQHHHGRGRHCGRPGVHFSPLAGGGFVVSRVFPRVKTEGDSEGGRGHRRRRRRHPETSVRAFGADQLEAALAFAKESAESLARAMAANPEPDDDDDEEGADAEA